VLGVAGLVAGLDFVEERGLDAIRKHEIDLCDRLRLALAELPGFEVFGHGDPARRVGTVSFRCEAIPAPELGGILDQAFDIAVRPGLHCAPYIHKALGTYPDGLVRVSPGPFSTDVEIDRLIDALKEVTGGI
jgi:selenocysteine lyase/cysteine desulfurase